jgi:hypothetical protein
MRSRLACPRFSGSLLALLSLSIALLSLAPTNSVAISVIRRQTQTSSTPANPAPLVVLAGVPLGPVKQNGPGDPPQPLMVMESHSSLAFSANAKGSSSVLAVFANPGLGYGFSELDPLSLAPVGSRWNVTLVDPQDGNRVGLPPYEPALHWWQTQRTIGDLGYVLQPAKDLPYAVSSPSNRSLVAKLDRKARKASVMSVDGARMAQVHNGFWMNDVLFGPLADARSFERVDTSRGARMADLHVQGLPQGHTVWVVSQPLLSAVLFVDQAPTISADLSLYRLDPRTGGASRVAGLPPSVRKPMLALSPSADSISVLTESLCSDLVVTNVALSREQRSGDSIPVRAVSSCSQVFFSRATGQQIESGWNSISALLNDGQSTIVLGSSNLVESAPDWSALAYQLDNSCAGDMRIAGATRFMPVDHNSAVVSQGGFTALGYNVPGLFSVQPYAYRFAFPKNSTAGPPLKPTRCGGPSSAGPKGPLAEEQIRTAVPERELRNTVRKSFDSDIWFVGDGGLSITVDPNSGVMRQGCSIHAENDYCYLPQFFDPSTRLLWLTCVFGCQVVTVDVDSCKKVKRNVTGCPDNPNGYGPPIISLHNWPERQAVVAGVSVSDPGVFDGSVVGISKLNCHGGSQCDLSPPIKVAGTEYDSGTAGVPFTFWNPAEGVIADLYAFSESMSNSSVVSFNAGTGKATWSNFVPLGCLAPPVWDAPKGQQVATGGASVWPGFRGAMLQRWDIKAGLCQPLPLDSTIFTPEEANWGVVDPSSGAVAQFWGHEGLLPLSTLDIVDATTGGLIHSFLVNWTTAGSSGTAFWFPKRKK